MDATKNKAAPSHGTASTPRAKYNAIDRFFSRHPALVLEILIVVVAMVDGVVIGGRHG